MAKAGAPPKFKDAHINWVFWKIANRQPMGRKMLVQETGLGEGSLRTILERLEEYDLVTSARAGRALTENGERVFKKLKQLIRMDRLGLLDMTEKNSNCLILVKGASGKVASGMEQRDEAIKVGRSGATTLVIENGRLMMPGFDDKTDLEERYPADSEKIKAYLNPEEGDVIVLGSEETPQSAEEAAWVAASTLLA